MKTGVLNSKKYADIIVINIPFTILFINQVDKDVFPSYEDKITFNFGYNSRMKQHKLKII